MWIQFNGVVNNQYRHWSYQLGKPWWLVGSYIAWCVEATLSSHMPMGSTWFMDEVSILYEFSDCHLWLPKGELLGWVDIVVSSRNPPSRASYLRSTTIVGSEVGRLEKCLAFSLQLYLFIGRCKFRCVDGSWFTNAPAWNGGMIWYDLPSIVFTIIYKSKLSNIHWVQVGVPKSTSNNVLLVKIGAG